jgi:hypothetical protein
MLKEANFFDFHADKAIQSAMDILVFDSRARPVTVFLKGIQAVNLAKIYPTIERYGVNDIDVIKGNKTGQVKDIENFRVSIESDTGKSFCDFNPCIDIILIEKVTGNVYSYEFTSF